MIRLGLLAALLVVLLLIIGLTNLVPWLLAARRDTGRTLVLLAIEALPSERFDWGQAMLTELDHIHCPRARRRFTLGCLRAALTRPPLLTLVIVAVSLAMAALTAGIVFIGALIVPSVTTVQSLNDRTENAVAWCLLLLASAGNGLVIGLVAALFGAAARKVFRTTGS